MKSQYVYYLSLFGLIYLNISCSSSLSVDKAFSHAQKQTKYMLEEIDKAQEQKSSQYVSPRSVTKTSALKLVPAKDWTSGFFPGELWFLYAYTHDKKWRKEAEKFTANLEAEKWNGGTHDMGFKIYCSYGNGYQLNHDKKYRDIIVQAAQTLVTRFNPIVGAIRSWDHNEEKWKFPVIIDNMMNLELLFEAAKITGKPIFYDIAVAHADTTLRNHFRNDNSSFHVVSYDPLTGGVEKKQTHQGYSDASAWSRGQAWGLYGFTMAYRETKDSAYLEQAEKIATFILHNPNLPKDLVPYWDYDDPNIPHADRDVAAAAIMASAFYELSTYSKQGKIYRKIADKLLDNLYSRYRVNSNNMHGFILKHSVGSKPSKSEVDVPLVYADYYYLEALLRKKKLQRRSKLF